MGNLYDLHKSIPNIALLTNNCFAFFKVEEVIKGQDKIAKFYPEHEKIIVWGFHESNSDESLYDMNLCRYKLGKRYVVFVNIDDGANQKERYLIENLECSGSTDYNQELAEKLKREMG